MTTMLSEIRVVTFNVLADGPCFDSFDGVPREALEWDYRKHRLLEVILQHNAEIICLQECNHFYDWFKPELKKHGYKGQWEAKDGGPCVRLGYPVDGVAIFWKRDEFDLERARTKKLLADYPQVALGVFLREKRTKHLLAVFNVHLKAKYQGMAARSAQIDTLLEWIQFEVGTAHGRHRSDNVILCGDFNESRSDDKNGGMVHRKIDQYRIAPFECLADAGAVGKRPFSTQKVRNGAMVSKVIDYIYSNAHKMTTITTPSAATIRGPIPSKEYPSDHVALCSELEWEWH